jgi:hypothetical protein
MWEVTKVKDNEFPIIKLDNGRAVMVKIYYGEEATSDGMTADEYRAVLNAFAMAKEALDMSLHDDCEYWPNGGRCQCPWCREAYPILDALGDI